MPVMDGDDIDDARRVVQAHGRIPLTWDARARAQLIARFDVLCRKVRIRTDSPAWLVDLALSARLRHAAAKGRNWAAAVQRLAGPRLDAIWLELHAARRLAELAQPEPADLREADPRYARFHLALVIEDEARPPRRAPKAEIEPAGFPAA